MTVVVTLELLVLQSDVAGAVRQVVEGLGIPNAGGFEHKPRKIAEFYPQIVDARLERVSRETGDQ